MKEMEEHKHKPARKSKTFTFRENNRPFHPERLADIIDPSRAGDAKVRSFAGVTNAKGSLWLANADTYPLNVQLEGGEFEIEPNMGKPFLSSTLDAVAKNDWMNTFSKEWLAKLELLQQSWQWTEVSGDRASELVCNGIGMDREAIEAGLRGALLTDAEIAKGRESWKELFDPFFSREDEEDKDEYEVEQEGEEEDGEEEVERPAKRQRRTCRKDEQ